MPRAALAQRLPETLCSWVLPSWQARRRGHRTLLVRLRLLPAWEQRMRMREQRMRMQGRQKRAARAWAPLTQQSLAKPRWTLALR